MMRPCLFVINILMLKTMVRAEVVADAQAWTHKDIAFNGAVVKDAQNRNVISPRMDFDEWTPLGRGDPLKNDPTFDYLPPVLDKVHYWKSPSAAVRAAHQSSSSTVASVVPPPPPHNYNRRFFLTDYSSKKEPAYVQYVQQQQQQQQQQQLQLLRKRPVAQTTTVGHLHVLQHYSAMPKVPLPMLTPPPLYQRPASQAYVTAAASDVPSSSSPSSLTFPTDAGDAAAESKQPPAVRAPPPVQLLRLQQTAAAAAVRPASHSAVIKVLLENEVDRTTVTTAATTVAAAAGTRTQPPPPPPPPVTDDPPPFAHYRRPAEQATGRPMYLIIQGHSKVKTYGLVSKSDDLSSTAAQPAAHEHNHIGSGPPPDEPSRRKRQGTGTSVR